MSSIMEGDIQLLRYHIRPYIWIPPPSCSHLFNFGSPFPLPFERSKLDINPPAPRPPLSLPITITTTLKNFAIL